MKALLMLSIFAFPFIGYSMSCYNAVGITRNKGESQKIQYYKDLLVALPDAPKMSIREQIWAERVVFNDKNSTSLVVSPEDFNLVRYGQLFFYYDGYRVEYHPKTQQGTVDKGRLFSEDVHFDRHLSEQFLKRAGGFEIVSLKLFRVHDPERSKFEKLPILTEKKLEALHDKVIPVVLRMKINNGSWGFLRNDVTRPNSWYANAKLVKILGLWQVLYDGRILPLSFFKTIEIRQNLPLEPVAANSQIGHSMFSNLHHDKTHNRDELWTRETRPANLETIEKLRYLIQRGLLADLYLKMKSTHDSPIAVVPVLQSKINDRKAIFYFDGEYQAPLSSEAKFLARMIQITDSEISFVNDVGTHKISWSEVLEVGLSGTYGEIKSFD